MSLSEQDEDGPVGADPLRGEELKPMSHPEADRLDATLHVVLQYIHTVCYKQGKILNSHRIFEILTHMVY